MNANNFVIAYVYIATFLNWFMIKQYREEGFGGRDRGRSGGFGGGRGGFGGGRGGGFNRGRDSGSREMFDATCSTCGKACRVPFRPTGAKPVLCSDCFGKNDSGSRFGGAPSSGNSKQLDQINAKLDKIIAILKELELDVDEDEVLGEDQFAEESENATSAPTDKSEEDFEEDGSEKIGMTTTEDNEEEF